jgi:hypothetical protein
LSEISFTLKFDPMRTHLIVALMAIASASFAQQGLEDVLYLKNGNVYRGVLVEQVPGQYYNIQTIGGNIFHVEVGDVAKITREQVWMGSSGQQGTRNPESVRSNDRAALSEAKAMKRARKDSLKKAWTPRVKGYFFQGQLMLENLQGGIRIVNGYKVGRFGHIGIGLGIDLCGPSPIDRWGSSSNLSGVYFPFYLYYGGDMLKRRITPFYALELGYAVGRLHNAMPEPVYDCIDCVTTGNDGQMVHGMTGGAGIGVRFNTLKRLNFHVLLNVNVKAVNHNEYSYYYDEFGNYYQSTYPTRTALVYPGIRFGIGF